MTGTRLGGIKAHQKTLEKYGEDWLKQRSREGGKVSHPNKGFGANQELARQAGRVGGLKSRRPRAGNRTTR